MRRGARRVARGPRILIDNRSGYDTGDLEKLFRRAILAMGIREEKSFIVVSAPQRSRGCAEVGGRREGRAVVIAMAPPSRFSLRRLARLLEHELGHTKGLAHDDMEERMLWSLGPVPKWAKGVRVRHRRRAPGQL